MQEIIVLDISFEFNGTTKFIYPVIIKSNDEMILIDCGYPNFYRKIKNNAKRKNIDITKINKLIITHHDYDHMGSLSDFKDHIPNLEIISSEAQKDYIEGNKKSLRLEQAENLYESLPDDQKPAAKNLEKLFADIKNVMVNKIVKDDEILKFAGGIKIIDTSGHMPGHISIYVPNAKMLIAGDALVIENNKLNIANPDLCLDLSQAKQSIKKLLKYDINTIICYHGGIFNGNIKESLEKLI